METFPQAEVSEQPERAGLVNFPANPGAIEVALEELELVFAFIYARVGNRPDTEDLTQQVAMKAIPRLREGSSTASIRAYLFATARTLDTETPEPSGEAAERVDRILAGLPANYRRVLELRFLRGYSLREVATEVGSTVGGVKVMQLRALRAAARVGEDA